MAALSELTGYLVREFQRWDSTAMLMVKTTAGNGDATVKLDCEPDELHANQEYRFVGLWKNHAKYGRQFHASSWQTVQPHTRQGVITYLRRAAQGLGFGQVRAAACYDEWGQGAVEKCRTHPGEVVDLMRRKRLRFDQDSAENLAGILQSEAALESCSLEILDLLSGRGFPKATVREAIRAWGARAAFLIRRDPFKLLRFKGCGFKRCDAMWCELGLPPGRLKRQALAAWYAIHSDGDGDTWYPIQVAVAGIRNGIGGTEINQEKALRLARLAGRLAEVRTEKFNGPLATGGDVRWVAERRNADNEREIAEIVAAAESENVKWF